MRNWDQRHFTEMKLHRVAPWIYAFVANRPELEIPGQLLAGLRREYHKSVVESIRHEACVRRLAAAFARHQIPMILLKGTYLGTFVYSSPALRPMCDVDALVKEEDLGRVQELLQELSFSIAINLPEEFKPQLYPSRPYVRPGPTPEILDLHSQLWAMDHYCLQSETVWQNSVEAEVFGCPARVLSAEMNFVHIAVHILGHPPLVRDRLDLMMILTQMKPDWSTILELAGTLGVVRPVYWVMLELIQDWECSMPPEIINSLRSYKPTAIEDLVIKSRFRYFWRVFSRVMSQKGIREKFQFLRLRLFPSAEYREAVLGTRDPMRYVYSKLRYFFGLYKKI